MRSIVITGLAGIAGIFGALHGVAPASAQVTLVYPEKVYVEQRAATVSRHVRRRTVRHGGKHVARPAVRQRTTAVRPRRTRIRSGSLPVSSGVGVRTNQINRSLTNQGEAVQQQQQNQFEVNQLRQSIDRNSVSGPAPIGIGSSGGRICPPGSTAC